MMKYSIKNQFKQAEMQGNELQIVSRETGSRKMTMQLKKQFKNQSQSGRSMVEMLGVLAIIAILSIGGIVGFRLAMNYYQANQIAHEMNIMRTDAQIKIAQGTEELMLGEPYDPVNDSLGHIQFNEAYLVDFDCIYMKTETSEPEPAFCTAANTYYIELQNIPEGVCKPLANLIDNMDNEIAFYINEKSMDGEGEEKGACGEGNNTLKVIFGADSDSEAIKCDTEGDCPIEQHICHKHVCVECKESNDCEKFEVCDRETGRCIDDCTKGACNSGVCVDGVCKECKNMGDCDNGLACIDNQCVSCESESDCEEKHCIDGLCVDCTEPTPKYNATENRCVECKTNDDCLEKGTEKPICNENNECEPCPEGEAWNDEFEECVVTSCQENSDCNINGKTGYYCYLDFGYSCEQEFNSAEGFGVGKDGYKSSCRKAEKDAREGKTSHYIISKVSMDWWSAWRFCDALGRKHATRESINCGSKVDGDFFCTSDIMNKLVADFYRAGWLDKDEGTCKVYAPSFDYGNVFPYSPETHAIGSGQALCQPE